MDMTSQRTFSRLARIAAVLGAVFIAWHYLAGGSASGLRLTRPGVSGNDGLARIRDAGQEYIEFDPFELPKLISAMDGPPPGELRIALLEHAGFHDEVIGALVKTLEDIGAQYTVYRNEFRWHFDTVLKSFLPNLSAPLHRDTFATHAKEGKIDVVIHTSCDYKWRDRIPTWVQEAFEVNHKMHVLCVQHELENLADRERDAWKDVADEGRFSLMTLSTHTTKELSRYVMKWEYQTRDPAWRNVPVDTLIPIFPVNPEDFETHSDDNMSVTPRTKTGAIPSRLAILGNIQPWRRDFQTVIDHLYEAIKTNPASWGYQLDPVSGKYISIDDPERPPVTLHLVGSKPDNVEIKTPDEIADAVIIHSELDYDDFYTLIASMDLIVPAFVNFVYVDKKLSSAIPAGIISRVPILSTPLLLEAYAFLRPPALVLHPSSMSEIEAIGLLRDRKDPMHGENVALPGYKPYQGAASRDEWDAYHARLYDANARVMRKLLEDVRQRGVIEPGVSIAETEAL